MTSWKSLRNPQKNFAACMLPEAPLQHDFRNGQNDSKVISEVSSQENVHMLISDKILGPEGFLQFLKVRFMNLNVVA